MKYEIQRPYIVEDKKIVFNDESIFKFLPSSGYGRGSKSDVYRIRVNGEFYALKIFNGLYKEDIQNYERKLNIDINSYISPLKLSYLRNDFNGYLMNYCGGMDLEKKRLNISVKEFALSVKDLEEDTHKLSELKFILYDTFIANVMYDGGFKMIDMDDYIYDKKKSVDEIDNLNNKRINLLLMDIFLNNTGLANLFRKNVGLTKLMLECTSGRTTFSEFYNIICNMSINYSNEDIKSISEIGKVLKKSKKM